MSFRHELVKKSASLAAMLPVIAASGLLNIQTVSAQGNALFETGHSLRVSMSNYSQMITDLEERGYSFGEDNDGNISAADLRVTDILVIVAPDIAYSDAEIAAIQEFLNSGGALLVMSNGLVLAGLMSLNRLLKPYGIQQTGSTREGVSMCTMVVPHPINAGVTQYTQASQGACFCITNHAWSLMRTGRGLCVLAASKISRVVAISDEYSFRDDYYNEPDNAMLMCNTLDWLSVHRVVDDVVSPTYQRQRYSF